MIPPKDWEEIIDGKRYSTRTSMLVARGVDPKTTGQDAAGWNLFLYRTADGLYFKIHLTPAGSRHHILEPISRVEALNLFGTLQDRCVDMEDAFPAEGLKNV